MSLASSHTAAQGLLYHMMASNELILALEKYDPSALDEVLEQLYSRQQNSKEMFRGSKYKIQKRGARDRCRVEKFSTYSGPDDTTRWILASYSLQWTRDPLSFWQPPSHAVKSVAPPGELIKFYINANCEDH